MFNVAAYKAALPGTSAYEFLYRKARLWVKQNRWRPAREILEALLEEPVEVELRRNIGPTLAFCVGREGDWETAIELYHNTIALYERQHGKVDDKPRADLYVALGFSYRKAAKWDRALKAYETSLQIAQRLGYQEGVATTLNSIGFVYRLKGWLERARAYCQQALVIEQGQKPPSRERLGRIHHTLGRIYSDDNRIPEAVDHFQKALIEFDEGGLEPEKAEVLLRLGNTRRKAQDWEGAHSHLEESIRILERIRDRERLAAAYNELGCINREEKNWKDALVGLNKSLELSQELGDPYREIDNLIDLARVFYYEGRTENREKIEELLDKADKLAKDHRFNLYTGRVAEILGNLAYDDRKYDDAFQYYVSAIETLSKFSSSRFDQTRVRVNERLISLPDPELIIKYAKVLIEELEASESNLIALYWMCQDAIRVAGLRLGEVTANE